MRNFLVWLLRPVVTELMRERYGLTHAEVKERKDEFMRMMGVPFGSS